MGGSREDCYSSSFCISQSEAKGLCGVMFMDSCSSLDLGLTQSAICSGTQREIFPWSIPVS
jgi:hypothetical protein